MSIDALLASACLPFVFQTVVIDAEPYWDGGYMGNPTIYPLIYHCDAHDIMIVQVNPLTRDEVPTTAADIHNRVNEISFNSSLMREMRAVLFVSRLVREERLDPIRYKSLNIHRIADEDQMTGLGVASKMNADMTFLKHLKAVGRAAADRWLGENKDMLGVDSTLDLAETFL